MTIPAEVLKVQHDASDPAASAWVAANAGSGKTHVLAQRVIRLLLRGTPPEKILGLTYTKAKADHMASDTVEGAQLALDLGPTLEAMLERGALPATRMPLTRAVVAAVTRDEPLDPDFALFHHV